MKTNSLKDQIRELKQQRNAVILAHNYVEGPVQDISDFVGDSLELSIKAKNAEKSVIVFCGVSFMAETAKILSPQSIVLHPEPSSGCPMSDMAPAYAVREYREAHPDTVLVAYVNTTAAVKAEVDICCTSANAEKIIHSIPIDKKIMSLPDQNLGANIMRLTVRKMELCPGYCPIHNMIMPEAAKKIRSSIPMPLWLCTPNAPPQFWEIADYDSQHRRHAPFCEETAALKISSTEHRYYSPLAQENPGRSSYR